MIDLIKLLLLLILNDLDSKNSKIDEDLLEELLSLLLKFSSEELNKLESANFIGVSRATFDNYIKLGLIPKGIKRAGSKQLFWRKSDLEKYLKLKND